MLEGSKRKEDMKAEQELAAFLDKYFYRRLEEKNPDLYCIRQQEEITQKAGIDVAIHSSYINKEILDEEDLNQLIDAEIAKCEFSSKITDFLAQLTDTINNRCSFILILVGGETSFKCANKINSVYLNILDAILPAVPLCIDKNNKYIVTKSGNFGADNTLVKIVDYFNEKL